AALTATTSQTNVNCFGNTTGTATAIPVGGTAPYTYSWNSTPVQTTITATALPAGTYTVTVTDSKGCTNTANVTITEPPSALVASTTASDYIISTCTSSNATLIATATGGVELTGGGYSYNWSPSAGLNYTNVQSPIAKPAVTTTYTVTVTDRNGCTTTSNVLITVQPALALTYTAVTYAGGYNITCNGASDGSINLTIAGGETPYVISWTGPSGYTSALEDISALKAGVYTVTVTDANGCVSTTSVTLFEPAVLTLAKTADVVLACFGDVTATGTFSVSGGTSPYTFTVGSNTSGATITSPSATSRAFTNGAAGAVQIDVTDANGCTASATITITQPAVLLPGSVDGDQEVCYLGDPSLLNQVTTPAGAIGGYLLQWEKASAIAGAYTAIGGAIASSYDPPAGITATTYYRRKVTSGSCAAVYSNIIAVTVNPLPVASISGNATICPSTTTNLTVSVTIGTSPFTVVLSNGRVVNTYISGDTISVHPAVTTTYTLVSVTDSKGCSISAPHANLTGSAVVTTKIVPVIIIQPVNATACEGDVALFTVNAGTTTNPSYQWYEDSGSGPVLMSGQTSATLNVTAATAKNGYKYSVTVSGDCPVPVTSNTVTLTVNELPEITTQPVAVTKCSGEDAVFTVNAGVTTNPVYAWYVNTGSGWSLASGARYSGTNTNTLTVVGVLESMSGYTFKVRVTGTCNPYVESTPVLLTVTRQAEITSQPVSVTLCEGAIAPFAVNAGLTTGPSYQWQLLVGAVWQDVIGETNASLVINPAVSAMNNNSYRVIVSSTCGSSVTSNIVDLVVNEIPEIITQPVSATNCEGVVTDFIVNAGVTTAASYRWQVSTDNGITWANINNGSTYSGTLSADLKINSPLRTMNLWQYRVIVSGTCTPAVTSNAAVLTVNTKPEIQTQPVDITICENTSTNFEVTAQGTNLTYQWFVDTGSGSYSALTNAGVYSGTTTDSLILTNVPSSYNGHNYRVEITGTCTPKTTSESVRLGVSVVTSITVQPKDSTVCEFNASAFSVTADGAGLTYKWQINTGASWTDMTNGGNYTGVTTNNLLVYNPSRTMSGYKYRVIVGSSCSADITSSEGILSINTSPAITAPPIEVTNCPGGTVNFSVTAEGTSLKYQWQINAGTGFTNLSNNATYSGVTTDILQVTIPAGAEGEGMNGHLFRVIVNGTCAPTATSSYALLRVNMLPAVLLQPTNKEVCVSSSATFITNVFVAGPETLQWQVNTGTAWADITDVTNYQGMQTQQLLVKNIPASFNTYKYRMSITGPCGVLYTQEPSLTVNTPPLSAIAAQDTVLVCGGIQQQLNGNPSGGTGIFTIHRWLGDIGPLSRYDIVNPVFNTGAAGNYNLYYSVTDTKGCIGGDTVVIKIERPAAMFSTNTTAGCPPVTVNITNNSTGYQSLIWDFGDGTTSTVTSPSQTYTNATASLKYYDIKLKVTSTNGCRDSMNMGITVYPEIDATFTASTNIICNGNPIVFTSKSGASKYFWDYGDGVTGYGTNIATHIYTNFTTAPVVHTVRMTATSFYNCTDVKTISITVMPVPLPQFSAVPPTQVYNADGNPVSFTNETNAGTWDYLWTFGDGAVSAVQNPSHTYTDLGEYTVTLVVKNANCSDSIKRKVSVTPQAPVADFDPIQSGCEPLSIIINNISLHTETPGTTFRWDFGDGSTSSAENPTYTWFDPGSYRVELTVTGPGGTSVKSQVVNSYPSPKAYFEVTPTFIFVNDEKVRGFNLSEDADSYLWEFGDGDTSKVKEPFHRYMDAGTFDITLWAYSNNGCSDKYILSPGVTVEPAGEIRFSTVFTPNLSGAIDRTDLPAGGTEVDQFFFPPIREKVLNYKLQIFNRLGVLIFESHDINYPWNGYYKGKLCTQGVYIWYVEGKYANGMPFKKVGDVTLLH
ncbi:MAG: PKD domain-containing protein, partial [Bacteroidia bacterium]|nr:PKD domain-containing protein [Bacteroidia bacterium]